MFFSNECFILRSSNGRTTDSDSVCIGSNPVRRSKIFDTTCQLIYNTQVNIAPSSNGRTTDFDSVYVGSIPAGASKINARLAQMVEQLISNQ